MYYCPSHIEIVVIEDNNKEVEIKKYIESLSLNNVKITYLNPDNSDNYLKDLESKDIYKAVYIIIGYNDKSKLIKTIKESLNNDNLIFTILLGESFEAISELDSLLPYLIIEDKIEELNNFIYPILSTLAIKEVNVINDHILVTYVDYLELKSLFFDNKKPLKVNKIIIPKKEYLEKEIKSFAESINDGNIYLNIVGRKDITIIDVENIYNWIQDKNRDGIVNYTAIYDKNQKEFCKVYIVSQINN